MRTYYLLVTMSRSVVLNNPQGFHQSEGTTGTENADASASTIPKDSFLKAEPPDWQPDIRGRQENIVSNKNIIMHAHCQSDTVNVSNSSGEPDPTINQQNCRPFIFKWNSKFNINSCPFPGATFLPEQLRASSSGRQPERTLGGKLFRESTYNSRKSKPEAQQ